MWRLLLATLKSNLTLWRPNTSDNGPPHSRLPLLRPTRGIGAKLKHILIQPTNASCISLCRNPNHQKNVYTQSSISLQLNSLPTQFPPPGTKGNWQMTNSRCEDYPSQSYVICYINVRFRSEHIAPLQIQEYFLDPQEELRQNWEQGRWGRGGFRTKSKRPGIEQGMWLGWPEEVEESGMVQC